MSEPKLSDTSKMPKGCKSWSLEAVKTCPGSRASNGELVEVCQGCYATTGHYHMPVVKRPRIHNREDWKREGWVGDMVKLLEKSELFRWFDSGDVYHPKLAEKILEVMRLTPHVKHWLPTRSYKIKSMRKTITAMKRLKNVSVRYSADKIGVFNKRTHGSVVFDVRKTEQPEGTVLCLAETRGNTCGDCRACWDKSIKTIAYPAFSKKMEKSIDRRAA